MNRTSTFTTYSKATKNAVFITAIVSGFITPFMGSALNVALPTIAKEFSMDAVSLSWINLSYLLVASIMLLPFGKIADIVGRKRIFLIGTMIYTITSFLIGMSVSSYMLIGLRAIQGGSSSLMFGVSMAIISSVFPPGERGKIIGWNIAAVYGGLSFGPFIGGLMTHYIGWQSIVLSSVPFGILVYFIVFINIKDEWAEAKGEKFDVWGSVTIGLSLFFLMYGLTELKHFTGYWWILSGFIFLIVFVIVENKTKSPILQISLLTKNRMFANSSMAALLNYMATSAVTFFLSLYLQNIKGIHADKAGAILITQPIIMAICSPFVGRLSDRIGSRFLATLGMSLTVAGLIMLIFLGRETPVWYVLLILFVLGFGFGIFSTPNMNSIMGAVDKRFYGVASAMVSEMRLVGQMLSMGIAILMISLLLGNVKISPSNFDSFISSMRYSFIIFTILCSIGIYASSTRGGKIN